MNDRLEKITSLHAQLERLRVKIDNIDDQNSRKIYFDQFRMIEVDANKLEDELISYELFLSHVDRILGAINNLIDHLDYKKV